MRPDSPGIMPSPSSFPDVSAKDEPAAVWAAALLWSLARDEAAGRRPQRLTEANLATWARFRGRLGGRDFVTLLFEDAAVLHPIPFDPATLGEDFALDRLDPSTVDGWLSSLAALDLKAPSADYVAAQAKRLAVSSRLARSDLHVVKPHQKVLELPGTGGQLAHHLVSSQGDLTLQDNFAIACATWQEQTLAGIVALELGAPHAGFVTRVEPQGLRDDRHPLRQRSFEFVVGVHPDKGGAFRVENELAIWFPTAKVLLV
jgi:hypothetical protein